MNDAGDELHKWKEGSMIPSYVCIHVGQLIIQNSSVVKSTLNPLYPASREP